MAKPRIRVPAVTAPVAMSQIVSQQDPAWRGADLMSQELAGWRPGLRSPDDANLYEREDLSGRIQDLVRSNGFIRGGQQSLKDNIFGAGWRLSPKPDSEALGIDPEVGIALGQTIGVKWRGYVDHPGRFIDARRMYNLDGLAIQAFTSWFGYGEALAVGLMEDRGGPYRTAIQMIDPARLCNPNNSMDRADMRAGVELGQSGEPVAYHIRNGHPYDRWPSRDATTWERVPRWAPGFPARLNVIHALPPDAVDQNRGTPPLSTVIEPSKLEERMSREHVMAAILGSSYALSIESPFDHDSAAEAMGAGSKTTVGAYQDARLAFHKERRYTLNGQRIPIMYPGEKINFHQPGHPLQSYGAFEEWVLRRIAAGSGMSYEQLARDFSKTNYSSARASLMEAWKFITGQKSFFSTYFMSVIYLLWLEELFLDEHIEVPPGAPDFHEAMAAYARCAWIGPGRGWIDPVKEVQAAGLRMELGLSTLEREAAEQGLDWRDVVEQRQRERRFLEEHGMATPDMRGVQPMGETREAA